MIIGIGVDIIEIETIQCRLTQEENSFKEQIFWEEEISYCNQYRSPAQHYAGRYVAKRATWKALGQSNVEEHLLKDVGIQRLSYGQPEIQLQENAKERYQEIGNPRLFLSISHSGSYAIAFVIAEI